MTEKTRKIAVIGRCGNTAPEAPWHDPSWEKWGLAWDMGFIGDRYYEIHHPRTWGPSTVSMLMDYVTFLQEIIAERPDDKIVLMDTYYPGAVAFPWERVEKCDLFRNPRTGRPYMESSIAWMMAEAFTEPDVAKIGLYGIDLTSNDEHRYQYPNMAFIIGAMRFSGMPVLVSRACAFSHMHNLDGIEVDYRDTSMSREDLEYCLGRDVARGKRPHLSMLRDDLLTSCFNDPPMYGWDFLPKYRDQSYIHYDVVDGKVVRLEKGRKAA